MAREERGDGGRKERKIILWLVRQLFTIKQQRRRSLCVSVLAWLKIKDRTEKARASRVDDIIDRHLNKRLSALLCTTQFYCLSPPSLTFFLRSIPSSFPPFPFQNLSRIAARRKEGQSLAILSTIHVSHQRRYFPCVIFKELSFSFPENCDHLDEEEEMENPEIGYKELTQKVLLMGSNGLLTCLVRWRCTTSIVTCGIWSLLSTVWVISL